MSTLSSPETYFKANRGTQAVRYRVRLKGCPTMFSFSSAAIARPVSKSEVLMITFAPIAPKMFLLRSSVVLARFIYINYVNGGYIALRITEVLCTREPNIFSGTKMTAPGMPTGLYTQVDESHGRIIVNFYPPSGGGQQGYLVYRDDGYTPGNYQLVKDIASSSGGVSYYDNYCERGRTYSYLVSAYNASGEGPTAGPVSGTLAAPTPPPEPEPPPPEPEPLPVPEPTPLPEPTPTPEPTPGTFVPGQNIRRIVGIVQKRLEEIRKEQAAGRWPPWGYP